MDAKLTKLTKTLLDPKLDAYDRKTAAEEVNRQGPKAAEAVPSLLSALGDSDSGVRKAVLSTLWNLLVRRAEWRLPTSTYAAHAIPVLVKFIEKSEDNTDDAGSVLGYFGALDELIKLSTSKKLKARAASMRGFSSYDADKAAVASKVIPVLVAHLSHKNDELRCRAAAALKNWAAFAEPAVPGLLKLLGNKDTTREGLETLSEMGALAKVGVPVIAKLLKSKADKYLRAEAASALANIGMGQRGARAALEAGTLDVERYVSDAAKKALDTLIALEAQADEAVGADTQEWLSALFKGDVAAVANGLKSKPDLNRLYRLPWNPTSRVPPLILAADDSRVPLKKRLAVLRLLLEAGAHVDQPDPYGMTPLHHAAISGTQELVEFLVKAGADLTIKSKEHAPSSLVAHAGLTPEEMAVAAGENAVAKYLSVETGSAEPSHQTAFDMKVATLRSAAFSAVDFEGSDEPIDEVLLGADRKDAFVTLGKSGSDSVFALWLEQPGADVATAPVVYLDSEGDPRRVVASSLDDFLTLLPYGTGFIYDLVKEPDTKLKHVDALANAGEAEGDIDEVPFLTWWKKTFHVIPAKSPAAVISRANKANVAFGKWLAPPASS